MEQESKRPRKFIKKALRILMIVAAIIIGLPVLVAGLLYIPAVQNRVVDWAAGWATDYVGSEVVIGGFYLEPVRTLRIEEVLIRDVRADTLFHVGTLFLEIGSLRQVPELIDLNLVELEDAFFNLQVYEGDTLSNLNQFIAAFPASTDTSKSKTVVHIECDDVRVRNLRFRYDDAYREHDRERIDFSHIFISELSGEFRDIEVVNDSITATVDGLRIKEQSGIEVQSLSGRVSVSSYAIRCSDLDLKTARSHVRGDYSMVSHTWSGYADFIDSVDLKADIRDGAIDYNDIAYFAPVMKDMLVPMQFTGQVSGTISNLRATIDSLRFADSGYLRGKVKLKGLPDAENLFIDADLRTFETSMADLQRIPIPVGSEALVLALPEELQRLEYVHFSGNLIGFVKDFVAFGHLHTALGDADTDINLKSGDKVLQYSGKLSTNGFELGRMLALQQTVGNVAFSLELIGQGTDLESLQVEARGKVRRLEVLQYAYQNIQVDGQFSKKVFEGKVNVRDTNVALDFLGVVDLNHEIPDINCVTRLDRLHLGKLNIVPTDTFGVLSSQIELRMSGNSLANLHGDLQMTRLSYENNERAIVVDSLVLSDQIVNGGHDITLFTDLVKAHVVGKTNLFEMPEAVMKVVHAYAPELVAGIDLSDVDTTQVFDFLLEVDNNRDLMHFLSPELEVRRPIRLHGKVSVADQRFVLATDSVDLKYGQFNVQGALVQVSPEDGSLHGEASMRRLSMSEDYFLENFTASSSLRNDSLSSLVRWSNQTEQADSGFIDLLLFRSEDYPMNAVLNQMEVRIAGVDWTSRQPGMLSADSNRLMVKDLFLESPSGFITCDGRMEEASSDHIRFNVQRFNLDYLSNFGMMKQQLKGEFNGDIDMYQRGGSFVADADVHIDSLRVDEFEIGTIEGESRYFDESKSVNLRLDLSYRGERNITVFGDYFPMREEDQLDLEASFNHLRVEVVEPFLQEYIRDLEGAVDGTVSIAGTLVNPEIEGALVLKEFEGLVQYLNTAYRIPAGKIKVEKDLIAMDAVPVLDQEGHTATINVQVLHDHFRDISYDIFIQAKNFLGLNTTLAQNEDYYGRAIVTGDINIFGYSGYTLIDVDAATAKGTQLFIPLSGGTEVGDYDYIHFVEPAGTKVVQKTDPSKNISNLELDFRLSVTDEAEVQIVFDEKIGDIIKARGNGDMLLRIDSKGNFNMYGDYLISDGDYLFTLQNLVNKRFVVESGSRISWNGDPDKARVDLHAVYKLRAAPYPMVAEIDDSEVYKQRLPVEVDMFMTGLIDNPVIELGVRIPGLPETDIANQMIARGVASDQAITSQVFSLLIASNFTSSTGGVAISGGGKSTTYEMISNQFSNWMSQYFDKLDVGVNLRKGDDFQTDQFEASLSREFLDDKLLVQVNGSVQGNSKDGSTSSSKVAGEANVEYKILPSLRGRFFNESNTQSAANINQSPYTQGVGIFYRKEFDSLKDLFTSQRKAKRQSQQRVKPSTTAPAEPELVPEDEPQ